MTTTQQIPVAPDTPPSRRRLSRATRLATTPTVLMAAGAIAVLAILVIAPLLGLINTTLTADNREAWTDVFASRLSRNLLWSPLANSLMMGLATAVLSTVIGGFLAWVVVMTRIPGRGIIGLLATIPSRPAQLRPGPRVGVGVPQRPHRRLPGHPRQPRRPRARLAGVGPGAHRPDPHGPLLLPVLHAHRRRPGQRQRRSSRGRRTHRRLHPAYRPPDRPAGGRPGHGLRRAARLLRRACPTSSPRPCSACRSATTRSPPGCTARSPPATTPAVTSSPSSSSSWPP
ncbi:hypothetical protein QP028_01450 [Corynebacterium suedekumii]|nr:hypothetical protein QP028_01450 [Corynebacterium suedekumii]